MLSINSTLSYLHLFLFGSMLQLFAEAVYNLGGETNAHDSLLCSKLCSTLWIRYVIAKYAFNIGFVGAIMALADDGKFVLEVFALFKYISQGILQRLRLLTPSDVKSKLLSYS